MKVGKDGTITWNKPRSTGPFTIWLFAATRERLFRLDKNREIASVSRENTALRLEPGNYNVVGGQIVATVNYLNLIEVTVDGKVTEKKVVVDDARKLLI